MYGSLNVDSQEQMEIGELGLDIWRIYMIQNLGDTLVKQILRGIEIDRVDHALNSKDIEVVGILELRVWNENKTNPFSGHSRSHPKFCQRSRL